MTEILVFFLGVGLYLYVLLGGADFGAGIVELFTGKRGAKTISKAIAPIWETNHVWIILVVVILFNGFPRVYTSISTYLHIPLLLALIGIIIRGSSFTFRYYDIPDKKVNEYYTKFFRISSMLTPFFFGIVMGAVILGRIPAAPEGSFYDVYVRPWFNLFPVITGMFVTVLFAWLASVFLIGEVSKKDQSTRDYAQISNFLLVILICLGLFVFIIAEIDSVHLLKQFSKSYISIGSLIVASVLVPLIWKNVKKHNIIIIRILAGAIALCILLGWFGIQLPVLVYISGGDDLTVWNSIAPEPTIRYLVYALIGGILIIFPSIAYLYKVFKFKKT